VTAERPLEGLRVLDLSRVLAGPFAGRILDALGADVVKVEPPEGDVTRLWGEVRHGLSGYFTQQNAGKRSVCIDLRAQGARDLVLRLAERADVVIENFRPGVLERLGIGWDSLRAANARLLLLSISGYGQTGPETQRAAYAPVIHGEAGLLARQAQSEAKPAADFVLSVADMNGGMHGVIGLLSALWMRERTGRGQHIDVPLFDAMLFTDDYAHFALDGKPIQLASGEVWQATGGPIMIAGDFRHVWRSLQQACALVDPAAPDASRSEKSRLRRELVGDTLRSFGSRSELQQVLAQANLAFGELYSTQEAFDSPTARAHDVAPLLDDRGGGVRRVVRPPYRFSEAGCETRTGAPYQGEHNAEVLAEWLSETPETVSRLERAGILLAPTARQG